MRERARGGCLHNDSTCITDRTGLAPGPGKVALMTPHSPYPHRTQELKEKTRDPSSLSAEAKGCQRLFFNNTEEYKFVP